jgi:hypothetical protein
MKNKLKFLFVLIFGVFALTFFVPKGETQTKTQTAGEKFKNIKVLNDMPADQMGKVMNLISASLGMDCNECHDKNDFSKDNRTKETARKMMSMTFDINKNSFNGRPEITCNTCHNGREHPQSAPNLTPTAQPERPAQPDKKPTVDEILAKYQTAIGGKAKLAKITSRYIKSQRVEADGKTIEAEEMWQKGNKLSLKTTYPKDVITEGFDGTNAWKKVNGNAIDLKTDEAELIKREAQIANGDFKSIYSKMDFRFIDKIDGREVYMVTAQTADNQRDRLFFDVQTGLLVRRTTGVPTVLGFYIYQVDYQQYKDFGGVKLPSMTKFAVPNISWTHKILEVKNNANVDDKVFMK